MTLRDYFTKAGVLLAAALPFSALTVRKERLLEDLPSPETVVFAAIPYYTEGDSPLSHFARVRDYHAFAHTLLGGACRLLQENHPGSSAVGFADHSPYNEVAGAVLAGLGVLGDHGLLITEPYASFVCLCSLTTTLSLSELEAEGIGAGAGILSFCEHCGACRTACPGGCIGDRVGGRDGSGREHCLSAVSQKKGALTPEEADALRENRTLWGCDICALACPHYEKARAAGTLSSPIPYFQKGVLRELSAETVLDMPPALYAAYPFGWRPKETLLRNLRLMEVSHD